MEWAGVTEGMRLRELHVCPVWEEPDGVRRPGLYPEDDHPPVVGWCNVLVIDINGEQHHLLAVHYEAWEAFDGPNS